MEVLFHFIFQLIKIFIQSSFYAFLVIVIFSYIGYFKPQSWFNKISGNKTKLWFSSIYKIYIFLFFFQFTYFGNHGLGDHAIIPIGHFEIVNQINGNQTYIEKNGQQLSINSFAFDGDKLFANIDSDIANYLIWDLKTDNWTFLKSEDEYIKIAHKQNYPSLNNFDNFNSYYSQYWHGWRFVLLP